MYRSQNNFWFVWSLRILAAISGTVILLIIFFLSAESWTVLRKVPLWRFFTDDSWHPAENLYNLTPMLWGTLSLMLGSVLVATPLGILSAVFCHYYAPIKIANLYRALIKLLSGIPSVVYGLWGLVVLVPMINRIQPPGPSLLAGLIVLSIMILPTIALVSDASLANVPQTYLVGASALGFSRWGMVHRVIFPAAKSGLFTGIILETGRAIGETMAVLMVCGNVVQTPRSLFDPIRTLTANVALEMAYAMGTHRSSLFISALVLTGIIILLVMAAERVSKGHIYD